MTKDNQIITLQKVEKETDYILKVKSTGKQAKESSMKSKFENRFLEELVKINASITKKNGVKKVDKVNQRIGRVIEKYPSAAKFYDIEVLAEKDIVTKIIYQKRKSSELNDQELGCYFIKTNLNTENELSLISDFNILHI
jgi:hypothetical protein